MNLPHPAGSYHEAASVWKEDPAIRSQTIASSFLNCLRVPRKTFGTLTGILPQMSYSCLPSWVLPHRFSHQHHHYDMTWRPKTLSFHPNTCKSLSSRRMARLLPAASLPDRMADDNCWYLVPQPTHENLRSDKIYKRCTEYLSKGCLGFNGYFRIICLWGGEEVFIREEAARGQMFKTWRENNPVALVNFRQRASKAGYWDPIKNDLRHTIFYYGQYFQRVDFDKAYEVFARNPQPEHAKSRTWFCLEDRVASAEPWTAHVVGLGAGLDSETVNSEVDDRPPGFDLRA